MKQLGFVPIQLQRDAGRDTNVIYMCASYSHVSGCYMQMRQNQRRWSLTWLIKDIKNKAFIPHRPSLPSYTVAGAPAFLVVDPGRRRSADPLTGCLTRTSYSHPPTDTKIQHKSWKWSE